MNTEETKEQEIQIEEPVPEETIESTEKAAEEVAAEVKEEAKEPTAEELLEQEKAKSAEMEDRWKRSMAEFDNFRKRTLKEKEQSFDRGAKDAVEKMLPVLDNFERALQGAGEEDPFVQGVNMIYKQLKDALTDLGVTEIEALGQTFDPNLHYAVSHVENEELGESTIAAVFQKGYKFKDTVVRCAMVQVAN